MQDCERCGRPKKTTDRLCPKCREAMSESLNCGHSIKYGNGYAMNGCVACQQSQEREWRGKWKAKCEKLQDENSQLAKAFMAANSQVLSSQDRREIKAAGFDGYYEAMNLARKIHAAKETRSDE